VGEAMDPLPQMATDTYDTMVVRAGMADLGGAIITGVDGNPLAVLARQLQLPLHDIREKCPMYLDNGEEAPQDLDDQVRPKAALGSAAGPAGPALAVLWAQHWRGRRTWMTR